jgi:FAD/FMN-containing dehydrogenase
MGGQQFCSGGLLLDTRPLRRVLTFDPERGTIDVEAGIQWPALLAYLSADQAGRASAWAIRQKQTGADRLSLGGALAANVHGRGLTFKPIVDDVESFTLVDGSAMSMSAAGKKTPSCSASPSGVTALSASSTR